MFNKKERAIVLGATSNWAFAIGTLLIGLKKHSPDIADNIIIYHDGFTQKEMQTMQQIFSNIIFIKYDKEYFLSVTNSNNIISHNHLKRYSVLSFSIYEIFEHLSNYKQVLWIDADMLILNDISHIFYDNIDQDVTAYSASYSLDVGIGSDAYQLFGLNGNSRCCNSGLVLVNDTLAYHNLKNECYQYTKQLWDTLFCHDQSCLSLVFCLNKIEFKPFKSLSTCSYNDEKSCDTSPMIHGIFTHGKFWIGTIAHHVYPEWNQDYQEWLKEGGSSYPETLKKEKTHIVKSFKKSDLLKCFNNLEFWPGLYEKIKFTIPQELKPTILSTREYLQFHIQYIPKYCHYELLRYKKQIVVAFHIEDKVMAEFAYSYYKLIEFKNENFSFTISQDRQLLSIQTIVDEEKVSEALSLLYTLTYHELHTIYNAFSKNFSMSFDSIYAHSRWGKGLGSGTGSSPELTAGYRTFLENFIKEHNIKSICDVGCGDWQFSKLIDWGDATYTGYDVSKIVIEHNKSHHEKDKISFKHYNGDFEEITNADLLICKDVLQHIPNAKISLFLNILPKFKFALISNNITDNQDFVEDIQMGGYRPCDIRSNPFYIECKEVFRIKRTPSRDIVTLLWTNTN